MNVWEQAYEIARRAIQRVEDNSSLDECGEVATELIAEGWGPKLQTARLLKEDLEDAIADMKLLREVLAGAEDHLDAVLGEVREALDKTSRWDQ